MALLVLVALVVLVAGVRELLGGVAERLKNAGDNPEASGETAVHLLKIFAVVLAFLWLGMFIAWLSEDRPGLVIAPFENLTEDKQYGGRAIADSLTTHIQQITRTHDRFHTESLLLPWKEFREGFTRLPALTPPQVQTAVTGLKDIGTVEIGSAKVPFGQVLTATQQIWPIGGSPDVIRGTLYRDRSTLRVVAMMEQAHHVRLRQIVTQIFVRSRPRSTERVRSWSAEVTPHTSEDLSGLLDELAVKIVSDLIPDLSLQQHAGFQQYTQILECFLRYQSTADGAALDAARSGIREMLKTSPRNRDLSLPLYHLAVAYIHEQRYGDAIDILENELKRIELGEQDGRTAELTLASQIALPFYLGYAHLLIGDYAHSAKLFMRSIRAERLMRCNQSQSRRAVARIRRQWRQLILRSPAADEWEQLAARAHVGLANVYFAQNTRSFDRLARRLVSKALVMDPNNPYAYNRLGYLCIRMKHHAEAIDAFQRAVQLLPRRADLHVSLALAYREARRMTECRASIATARWLAPEDTYQRACLEAVDPDGSLAECLRLLKRSLVEGTQSLAWAQCDEDFRPIRRNPAFREVVGLASRGLRGPTRARTSAA